MIGIIAIIAVVKYILDLISQNTDTNVISNEGLEILEDPDKKIELRKAVDEYHQTGDWSKTELNSII
ncbi:hypothetical protein [Salegentibacter sp. 24]|uniref:hypothetical protein n=1 Tax=Salegentibacter sp. 24 TaxID=2183986 RepID=UPI001061F559|nr:hypothetical protein [Salegentibacter sp. 24]